jgi:hypothetical protein
LPYGFFEESGAGIQYINLQIAPIKRKELPHIGSRSYPNNEEKRTTGS